MPCLMTKKRDLGVTGTVLLGVDDNCFGRIKISNPTGPNVTPASFPDRAEARRPPPDDTAAGSTVSRGLA